MSKASDGSVSTCQATFMDLRMSSAKARVCTYLDRPRVPRYSRSTYTSPRQVDWSSPVGSASDFLDNEVHLPRQDPVAETRENVYTIRTTRK